MWQWDSDVDADGKAETCANETGNNGLDVKAADTASNASMTYEMNNQRVATLDDEILLQRIIHRRSIERRVYVMAVPMYQSNQVHDDDYDEGQPKWWEVCSTMTAEMMRGVLYYDCYRWDKYYTCDVGIAFWNSITSCVMWMLVLLWWLWMRCDNILTSFTSRMEMVQDEL